jgi:S-formylglutathione hydrolase FrmB
MKSAIPLLLVAFVLVASPSLLSQAEAPQAGSGNARPAASVFKGKVERVKVHGPSLDGNLMGESSSPEVSIYLPPSYAAAGNRRYPVVYFLHGYTGTDLAYFGPTGRQAHVRAEAAFAAGAQEKILVTPNAMNAWGGSMYSNSVTTGNWEGYIAEDLVAYIDQNYRTIARREGRGLSGHSMGGYGALRIGMKYPHVFSALYAMSSCCLNEGNVRPGRGGQPSAAEQMKTVEEARGNRGAQGTLARAAAWAPNPQNPPFFLDLPTKNGEVQPAVAVKWAANSPYAMLDQYVPNLKKYTAIALDVGLQDGLISSNQQVVDALKKFGVAHTFETCEGDHNNRVPQRLEEKVVPFFAKTLTN